MNKQLQAELVSDLIDTAGYVIGYWVARGYQDDEAQTYTIVLDSEVAETVENKEVVITYAQIRTAIRKIASGKVTPNKALIKAARDFIFNPEDADLDAEFGDVAIQVAAFGEIVFG